MRIIIIFYEFNHYINETIHEFFLLYKHLHYDKDKVNNFIIY